MVVKSILKSEAIKQVKAVICILISLASLFMGFPATFVRAAETCDEWVAKVVSVQGIVQARKGKLEAALQSFSKALEIKPQYMEARINRALIMEQKGMAGEAAAEYRYILQQAPQYPRADEMRKKIEKLEGGNR